MGLTRILRSQAATLSHTFYIDETATDSSVDVTYTVIDANSDAVTSGTATSAGVSTGRYTFTLASQSALKRGRIAWTATIAGAVTTEYDYFEIVGGFYFGLKEGRDSDTSLSDTSKYTTAEIRQKRLEVETECETICDRSFVPRYERVVLDGTGTNQILLRMNDPVRSVADIRTIRAIKVAPDLDETFVAYTAGQLAGVSWSTDGQLTRTDGAAFTFGRRNVLVEFEYGLDGPQPDLVTASLTRLRSRLNLNKTAIPDRATSYTIGEMGVYRLSMPGAFETGLPEVDAVYSRYSRRSGTGPNARKIPASRSLTYNPQAFSLFHGKR